MSLAFAADTRVFVLFFLWNSISRGIDRPYVHCAYVFANDVVYINHKKCHEKS